MPFVKNVAIIAQADVEAITHEDSLLELDADGATFAETIKRATNYIIKQCRFRSWNPTKISNTDDFEAIAAYWTVIATLGAQPRTPDIVDKLEYYEGKLKEEWATIVVEYDGTQDQVISPRRGGPVVINRDRRFRLAGPVDNDVGPQDDSFTETR